MKADRKYYCKIAYRMISTLLLCSMLAGCLPMAEVQAANKELSIETAKSMALSQSMDYQKLQSQLALAKGDYADSIRSIKEKERNQKTFRWSPLLNFKFPEKPDLPEQVEYTYKPLELQSQIDTLNHSLTDCVYGIYEDVALRFTKVYVLQEKIAFNEKRIASYQKTVDRNRARLATGLAKQEDVDAMQKKLDTLNSTLATDMRSIEAEKKKLGDLIGIDVSTSYTFKSPFVSASLDRNIEEELIEYTLEHDDAYYQAKVATSNGLMELDTNYKLMESQYGSKLRIIDSFVNQAKRGEKMNSAAFKLKYEELLKAVDNPWQGHWRILFIKIPKEWIKGSIDGIRYVEDEPYALYESSLEYQSLYVEEQAVKKDLISSVNEYYNNYVSTLNTVRELERQNVQKEQELQKAAALNASGSMTYDEYALVQEEYEDFQMDLLTAKSAHTEIMYSFDRLTCGALSAYFKGEGISMSAAEGGQSYIVEDEGDGVYYYIHSMVENNVFELGLSVPDDFDTSITDYELWIDGTQIGERTEVAKVIRHLALDIENVQRVFIRLYDGDTFVDDCDIDPSIYSEKLTITTYHIETTEDDQIGTYSVTRNSATGMVDLKLTLNADQMATSFSIKTANGVYLLNGKKISVKDKFRYLAALENSIDDLIICLYDESGALLGEATFRSADQTLRKKGE